MEVDKCVTSFKTSPAKDGMFGVPSFFSYGGMSRIRRPMGKIRIAAVCMNSQPGEIEKNLDKIEAFVVKASDKGVDIICFPELSITGYVLKNPLDVCSRSTSERAVERVMEMARSQEMTVMAGIIEREGSDKPYISHVVADRNGLMGLYRKTHLSPTEEESYKAGQSIDTFCYGDIIFGIQLCYESHFPEISTVMSINGAKIIFIPHASPRGNPDEKTRSWLRHLPARAFDNALFVVACNQTGNTEEGLSFPGVAIALNPSGHLINQYRGKEENMLLTDLDMDELQGIRGHRMKYFIPNRRPELYREISLK